MFFGKMEKRRHPYATMMVGTLATIGAVHVVKCVRRASRCMKNKMITVFRGSRNDIDSMV